MQIDLFYELAVPQSGGRDETQVYHETLDEISLADQLGFNGVWLVEHHFMPEYSHSSAPELFLAAASQRTRRLRLGHGVIVLPYNHPVRVAERIAALDILSGGRSEIGVGRGFSPKEYAIFGARMADSRDIVQESLDIIREGLSQPVLNHRGRLFVAEDVAVLPKPLQRPHPPLWTAAVSPDTYVWAAEQGIGALAGPFKPWFMVKQDLAAYRRAWRDKHGDGPPRPGQNQRFAMTVGVLCLADGDEARRLAQEHFTWYYARLLAQTRPVLEKFQESYGYYKKLGYLQPLLKRAINLPLLESMGMVVVGSPAECVRKLERYEKAGVDHLICAVGAGAMPSSRVRESLELMAQHILPRFQRS
ncbi:LLM class flavin-dependent oxidoreductase [Thermithiobacillus plumbiphilus]|uniref:LLM class flavin-dependent oxidoreductase n=1 Tax=Thermithiobacillus plumbiphilus TaxID=1729899 RepID=A0ABU9D5E9_9PROT